MLHHCQEKAKRCGDQDGASPLSYLIDLQAPDLRQALKGIGAAKTAQILAALQLGRRAATAVGRAADLSNPRAVYGHLAARMDGLEHEEFWVLLLNAKNRLIDEVHVSRGTLTASLVHPREIFKPAVRAGAHGIILAHNHPSGDPAPSREDREVTQRLIQSGRVIGIEVLDHLVVGKHRYVSFREQGLAQFS